MGRNGKLERDEGPVRAYVARYKDAAIDSERARQEAAAASELAKRFLSYWKDAPLDAI